RSAARSRHGGGSTAAIRAYGAESSPGQRCRAVDRRGDEARCGSGGIAGTGRRTVAQVATGKGRGEVVTAIIRTQELTKRFGPASALVNLTLEAPAGSVFALLGPNGAGKTTAIKILMNLVEPTSGYAEVVGVEGINIGPAERAKSG